MQSLRCSSIIYVNTSEMKTWTAPDARHALSLGSLLMQLDSNSEDAATRVTNVDLITLIFLQESQCMDLR